MTAIGANSTGFTVSEPDTGGRVTLSWAAATETGNHRAANEDSYSVGSPVFAVADGMGGHSAGDVASDAVVRCLAALTAPGFATLDAVEAALANAVEDLRNVLTEDQRGAGTTVTGVALVQEGGQLQWAAFNIGDSRVYALISEDFSQVTVDHSVVQQLVDAGQITREEADYHPHSNVITRAVGISEVPIPDYVSLPVVAGMRILLCSDGLTKELTDIGIEHFMRTSATPTDAVDALVKAALANSGRDNVTVVIIDVMGVSQPEAH